MSFTFNNPLGGWCVQVAQQLSIANQPCQSITEVSEETSRFCKQSKSPVQILVKHHSLESDEKSESDSDLPTTASCSAIIGIMDENKDPAQPRKTVKFIHCSSSTSDLEEDEVGRGRVGDACFAFRNVNTPRVGCIIIYRGPCVRRIMLMLIVLLRTSERLLLQQQ